MADYLKATMLRKGQYIRLDNEIWCVMDMTHVTPGKGRAHVQTKLRNVKIGNQTENRFRSDEQVERVRLDEVEMEFLYQDGDDYHFMNTGTYDQIHLNKETLGDRVAYLAPNMKLIVVTYEGTPLDIIMPSTMIDERPGEPRRTGSGSV